MKTGHGAPGPESRVIIATVQRPLGEQLGVADRHATKDQRHVPPRSADRSLHCAHDARRRLPGEVEVISTRPIRDGISARAVATYRGRAATYRATIVPDKVTVTRTLDPV